ncbi:cysteine desulfurase family protein [Specibacter sp. NPDC057265]|uniref:cysteine desulfurase family protein n=1 Tax=Specibacter sp. NPDC057265 TaxID=3346075 RepID=UPI0036272D24
MIYLDAASTTPVRREAIEAMFPFLTNQFGNPSSHHELGELAAQALAQARERCAAVLGVHAQELVFTSGGTEGDNMALKGLALARRAANPALNQVVISAVEHPAIVESARYLDRVHGFEVLQLPVNAAGEVSAQDFAALLGLTGGGPAPQGRGSVAVASVMYANNEVGTVQDIAALARLAAQAQVPLHSDAVQAAGWLPLQPRRLGVAALTLSGHKIGAPKGSGLLYLRAGTACEPLIHGGGQERGARSGTPNVAFAVALATALELAEQERTEAAQRVAAQRDEFTAWVLRHIPGAVRTGHARARLPGVASFCFPGTSGESLLLELERRGIVCSSGSACAAGSDEPSPVLTAMGMERSVAQTALRLSFNSSVTAAELAAAGRELAAAVQSVQRFKAAPQQHQGQ